VSGEGADACRDFWSRRNFRLWAGGFVAVAAVVLVFAPGVAPADGNGNGTPSVRQVGVGNNCTDSNSTVMAYDRAAHPSWARIFVYWNSYETSPGRYSPTYFNANSSAQSCIAALHDAGIPHVLVDLYGTPQWAWSGAGDWTSPPTNAATCLHEACYGAAAAHLVSAFANVCGARQYAMLCGVQAVEVWNEEDTPHYWSGTEHDYENLLKATYPQLHSLGVTVVLGGTAKLHDSWHQKLLTDGCGQPADPPFVGGCGQYGQYFDVIGVHTYVPSRDQHIMCDPAAGCTPATARDDSPDIPTILNGDPTGDAIKDSSGVVVDHDGGTLTVNANGQPSLAQLCDINAYCGARNGGTGARIWITEMGAKAGPGHWLNDVQNANMLTNFYEYIGGQPVDSGPAGGPLTSKTCSSCSSRVEVGFWFTDYLPTTSSFTDYDMLDATHRPKPEYAAFASLGP
jgi:hypothetical protein